MEPIRTCIACRAKKSKSHLLRLVVNQDVVIFDERKHLPGRGAYVCVGNGCITEALKSGRLAKAFKRLAKELRVNCGSTQVEGIDVKGKNLRIS